jgi:hypothetical protein
MESYANVPVYYCRRRNSHILWMWISGDASDLFIKYCGLFLLLCGYYDLLPSSFLTVNRLIAIAAFYIVSSIRLEFRERLKNQQMTINLVPTDGIKVGKVEKVDA